MSALRQKHHTDGFSLLTVVIILTASMAAMAAILPGQDAGDYNKKTLTNIDKLNKVEEAMTSFMLLNGRRPCPADGQYDINVHNFGLEAANPGSCVGGPGIIAPIGPGTGASVNIVQGVIPTKTLNLPDEYAFDEWGRRFTYVVDTRATIQVNATANSCIAMTTQRTAGAVQVIYKDTGGNPISTDNVMYAYISHGPDGHGAFPQQGSNVAGRINTGNSDADTDLNAGVDNTFAVAGASLFQRTKKDRTPTFDDLVYYQPRIKNTCCVGASCKPPQIGFQASTGAADNVGVSVATADINGDGISDLIIGAANANGTRGVVYVVFGTKLGFPDPLPLNALNGSNGFNINGISVGDVAGDFLAAADINGDGIDDIIIGAPQYGTGSGLAYVVFGKTTPWLPTYDLALNGSLINGTNGFRLDGAGGGGIGYALATGDVNGDGISDIILGATWENSNAGNTYVVFGQPPSYVWPVDRVLNAPAPPIDGTHGFRLDGIGIGSVFTGDNSGFSVASGDINGDGIADIIIGAWHANAQAGYVYVVFGKKTAWPSSQPLNIGAGNLIDGTQGFRIDGQNAGDLAGYRVAAGDINGDGIADLVLTALGGSSNAGWVYTVFGHPGTWYSAAGGRSTLDLTVVNGTNGFVMVGTSMNDYTGFSITTADMNCDGYADLLIGAPYANGVAGYQYVVFGHPTPWNSAIALNSGGVLINGTNGFRLDGPGTTQTGWSTVVGDVNGDGKLDILLGAPNTNGKVFVYNGKGCHGTWPNPNFNLGGL